jgi:hypothetical protein
MLHDGPPAPVDPLVAPVAPVAPVVPVAPVEAPVDGLGHWFVQGELMHA